MKKSCITSGPGLKHGNADALSMIPDIQYGYSNGKQQKCASRQ